MADKKKQEPKSNAPMLIIGLVLIVGAVAGWYLLTKPKVPTPARATLVAWCEDGTFETAPRKSSRSPYLVFEDSFLDWVERLNRSE